MNRGVLSALVHLSSHAVLVSQSTPWLFMHCRCRQTLRELYPRLREEAANGDAANRDAVRQ